MFFSDVITCNRKSEGNLICKFGYQNKYYDSLKGREFYDRNNFLGKELAHASRIVPILNYIFRVNPVFLYDILSGYIF